jgi:hypothetical protein
VNRSKLRLNDLFVAASLDLDHTFVVFFTGFGHAKNVLANRRIGKHHASRAADASLPFIIDINLGTDRGKDNQPRDARLPGFINVFRGLLKFFDPCCYRRRTICRIDLESPHDHAFHICRHIGSERGKRRRFMHYLLHDELHQIAREGCFATKH